MVHVALLAGLIAAIAPVPDDSGAGRAVQIVVVAQAEDSEATKIVLDELLEDSFAVEYTTVATVDLREVVTPRPDASSALARVWIDLSVVERATIYIVDGDWSRILIRHVPTPEGYGEIQREQVAHIAGGSIEALAGGARLGIEREEAARELGVEVEDPPPVPEPAPQPPVSPPPAPAEPSVVATWLNAGYEVAAFAAEPALTHGPALAATVELRRPRLRPGFGVGLSYRLPVRVSTPDVNLRLDDVGLRFRVGLGPAVSRRVVLRPWIGAGTDLVRVSADARNAQTEPFPDFWAPVPMLELGLGVGLALREALELRLAAVAEVDPLDTTYEFEDSGAAVFDPWIVRATVHVGLGFDPLAIGRSPSGGS